MAMAMAAVSPQPRAHMQDLGSAGRCVREPGAARGRGGMLDRDAPPVKVRTKRALTVSLLIS